MSESELKIAISIWSSSHYSSINKYLAGKHYTLNNKNNDYIEYCSVKYTIPQIITLLNLSMIPYGDYYNNKFKLLNPNITFYRVKKIHNFRKHHLYP